MPESKYLIISGHDFRSKRKTSVHFIALELSKVGKTQFFSLGFSWISRLKKDPRLSLWNRSNKIENLNGVDCFLWKTHIHPINLRRRFLQGISEYWFEYYVKSCPRLLIDWIKNSEIIMLESGMAPIFFDLVKLINPQASIIYLCSDGLETIDCSPVIINNLKRVGPQFSRIRIPSKFLISEFPDCKNVVIIPHGMDPVSNSGVGFSPYGEKKTVVSVGQMLFDPSFFKIAAKIFPDFEFHIIGGGVLARHLSSHNIKVYDEMPYEETLRFLKYASAGVAAYDGEKVQAYLADTSLKLRQFAAFGLPAICPELIASGYLGRYGYQPGNEASIACATRKAIESGPLKPSTGLQWSQVVERLVDPQFI